MGRAKAARGRCPVCLKGFTATSPTWDDELGENVHPGCRGRRPKPMRTPRGAKPPTRVGRTSPDVRTLR